MDITFTRQDMSKVGPIEEPQIPEYYGRIDEIYELTFCGSKAPKPVIFKCHWFDPQVTRRTPNLGLVEIHQDSVYPGEDVYVVAQ
jgi:hypothetical protein